MALIIAIIIGCLLGLSYSRKGLFLASIALVSVLLSAIAGLAFAASVEAMVKIDSPYSYPGIMLGVAIFAFVIVRGALAFIDENIEFHSVVDRIGGAVMGLMAGLLGSGFIIVCLLCSPTIVEKVPFAETSMKQSSSLILIPSQLVARIVPGDKQFDLEAITRYSSSTDGSQPEIPESRPAGTDESDLEEVSDESRPAGSKSPGGS